MRYIKYLCLIILPLLIFAQDTDDEKTAPFFTGDGDRSVLRQGCVLAISGDSINFEERWVHPSPTGVVMSSEDGEVISFKELRPPFWAEVSYYRKGPRVYLKTLHFLKQLEYSAEGYIIQ